MPDSEFTIKINAKDMDEEYIEKVKKITFIAFKEHRKEKNIANYIKNEMDKVGGHGWNCVVGRNFGSHVIHQTNKYIFYSVKELCILLWRS